MVPFVYVHMNPLETVAVQARTEIRDAAGSDPNDFEYELTPQARWDAIWNHGNGHFVIAYTPRFVISEIASDSSQGLDAKHSFLDLHQVSVGTEIEGQRYHLAAYGNFAYGPITTTALLLTKPWLGEGLPVAPGVIIPDAFGSQFNLLFYQVQLGVPIHLTRRLDLIPFATYNAFGGADSNSRDTIPMVRGPGASLTLDAHATREDDFKTKIGAGQAQAYFGGDRTGASFVRAEFEERWQHKWSELSVSELAVGASFAEDQFTGSAIYPTAEANTIIDAHTRALETKLALIARVQPWLDPLSGNLEQRAEAIGAVNFNFPNHVTLRAQGGYASILKDSEFPATYEIASGEGGVVYKITRRWSVDASLRYSHQLFINPQRSGDTGQWLGILGATWTPHDWKL